MLGTTTGSGVLWDTYNLFDAHAELGICTSIDFWADLLRSDSVGLLRSILANLFSFSPDLPRAFFFCLGLLHAANIPICASFSRLRVHGEQAVDGDTRYTLTAAAVWKSAPPIASCS